VALKEDELKSNTLYMLTVPSVRDQIPLMKKTASIEGRVDILRQTREMLRDPGFTLFVQKVLQETLPRVEKVCIQDHHVRACRKYKDGITVLPLFAKYLPATPEGTDLRTVSSDGHWRQNSIREILFSTLLSALVERSLTPHFPLMYASAYAAEYTILSECCEKSFEEFLLDLVAHNRAGKFRQRLLQVALLQIVHGLAVAQKHFGFMHGNLHGGNAMVSYIYNVMYYTYKVGGKCYSIPTHGMCWKLVNFGFSSAGAISLTDNNDVMTRESHLLDDSDHTGITEESGAHASEMYDIFRLVTSSRATASASPPLTEVLKTVHTMATALSLGGDGTVSGHLMEKLFVQLAAEFNFKVPESPAHVFDSTVSLDQITFALPTGSSVLITPLSFNTGL
jgi:hypothetical protein